MTFPELMKMLGEEVAKYGENLRGDDIIRYGDSHLAGEAEKRVLTHGGLAVKVYLDDLGNVANDDSNASTQVQFLFKPASAQAKD